MNGRERHSTGYGSKYLYLPTGDKKPLEPDKSLLGKFFSETRLGKSTIGSLRAIVRSLPTFVSLATLLASTLTLLYVVRPDLKSPEKLGATISKVEIELGVARGDYNQETHAASDTKPFDTEGVMIYATIDLEGFRRRAYIIDQVLYDAGTRQRRPINSEQYGSGFVPNASADRIVATAWSPNPPKGNYFMRVFLYDVGPVKEQKRSIETKELLGFADSKPFTLK